jgi:hypothetical protein
VLQTVGDHRQSVPSAKGLIPTGDIRAEDSPRLCVSDDVMTQAQQPVLVVIDPKEAQPEHGAALEIERLARVAPQDRGDPLHPGRSHHRAQPGERRSAGACRPT